jgi:hypothetical protein
LQHVEACRYQLQRGSRGKPTVFRGLRTRFLVNVNDAQNISGFYRVTALGYEPMIGLGTPNGSSGKEAPRAGK